MTLPRELSLKQMNGEIMVASNVVKELRGLEKKSLPVNKLVLDGGSIENIPGQFVLKFNMSKIGDYSIILSNDANEQLVVGFDSSTKRYYIDFSKSRKRDFNPAFEKNSFAPRFTDEASSDLELVFDSSSVELFADGGLTVMTSVFFPTKLFDHLQIKDRASGMKDLKLIPLTSIW
jgi:fructan beta-fructosidase